MWSSFKIYECINRNQKEIFLKTIQKRLDLLKTPDWEKDRRWRRKEKKKKKIIILPIDNCMTTETPLNQILYNSACSLYNERKKQDFSKTKQEKSKISLYLSERTTSRQITLASLCLCFLPLPLSLSLCFALSLKQSDSSLRGVFFLPECVYLSPSLPVIEITEDWFSIVDWKCTVLMMVLADSGFYLKAQWNTNFLWNLVFVGLDGG